MHVFEVRHNWIGLSTVELKTESKDLRLWAQVAIKTANVVIWRCCSAEDGMELLHSARRVGIAPGGGLIYETDGDARRLA